MLYATVNFPQFEDNKYIKLNTFHKSHFKYYHMIIVTKVLVN